MTWSSFLREPSAVEGWLEEGEVVLKRRDGPSLVLARDSQTGEEQTALSDAARLFAAGLKSQSPAEVAALASVSLPWTRFLPEGERRQFVQEFVDTLEACADLGDFSAFAHLVAGWRSTARAHSEGLADELQRPVRDIGPKVPRPRKR
jgi:hypothetical protein